ncbi:MAG: hypothetical protein JO053_08840 [Acidobacteria bacterium]|nr:hypothetical protein [Acidobacteriota bacterium]
MKRIFQTSTAGTAIFSIVLLALPFTSNGWAQRLDRPTINEINALAAYNVGKPYQAPTSTPGVAVATVVGSVPGYPYLVGPVNNVSQMLPLIREAANRKLLYYAGAPTTRPVLMQPYTRTGYPPYLGARMPQQVHPIDYNCTYVAGAGNCEKVGDLYFPKCKVLYVGNGATCAQDAAAYNTALASYLKNTPSEEAIQNELQQAITDQAERLKLAPFVLQVTWEALASDGPTPQQLSFRKYFEYFASLQNQMATQYTLVQWCKFKKNYPQTPGSILIGIGPTSSAFTPEQKSMLMGQNGIRAIDTLLSPAMVTDLARRDPYWAGEPMIAQGRPMDQVLSSMGLTGPAAAAVISAMNGTMPDGWPYSGMPLALKVKGILTGSVAPSVAKTVAIQVGKIVLERLIGGIVGAVIAEGIGLPASIIALALEILIKQIMAFVQTNQFEADLVKGARSPQPVDSHSMIRTTQAGYGDSMKIGVLAYLIKMMIVDPADGTPFGPPPITVINPIVFGDARTDVNYACSAMDRAGTLR